MTLRERFEAKWTPEPFSGCWLWTTSGSFGYGKFWLNGSNKFAHRVAWKLYVGDIPDGLCVLHKCDTRACVNPNHLFLGTKRDNIMDCVRKWRWKGVGKTFSDQEIKLIRSSRDSQRKIASKFGVAHATIGRIKRGNSYRGLTW